MSEVNEASVCRVLLNRTIGALELAPTSKLVEGVTRYDMTADKTHRWISIAALLAQDGARKHRVELASEADLDGEFISGTPDSCNLALQHYLLNVKQGRQR